MQLPEQMAPPLSWLMIFSVCVLACFSFFVAWIHYIFAKKRVHGVRHKLHNVTILLTITKETNTAKNIVFGTSTKWL
jgi:hypothetical protein